MGSEDLLSLGMLRQKLDNDLEEILEGWLDQSSVSTVE